MNNGLLYFPRGPDQLQAVAVPGASRGLVIQSNGAAPNTKLDIAADEVLLRSEAGLYQLTSAFSAFVDITVSGLGGGDGFTEAAGTWYYIWLVGNGLDVGGLLSLSATAPNLPSGFEYRALLGAVFNDGGSNFRRMWQAGRRVFAAPQTIIGADVVVYTSLSVASAVPAIARTVTGLASVPSGILSLAGDANGVGELEFSPGTGDNYFELPLMTPQNVYYTTSAIAAATLVVSGFTL